MMTDEARDAAVGSLIQDYDDVCRKIACLKRKTYKDGQGMSKIAADLINIPDRMEPPSLDFPSIVATIEDLKTTQREKERIEHSLRQANLDRFIQK